MDRRINIVDDDEVARAMAMAAEGKKGKGKKKAIDGGAFKSSTSNKSASLPEPKRKVVATGTHPTGTRFYEAYGLKIPLFDNSGKRRPNARLSKSLTRHSVVELLDIVAQIAGDDKKEELRNKGLPKAKLANWIEEKETLALGRHPISELPLPGPVKNDAEQIGGSASLLTPTTPVTIKLTMKPTAATSVINTREGKLESAAGGDDTGHHPGDKKRRAQDEAPRGQPHQKHQKRHRQANLETITTDTSAKGNQTSKPDNDSTSTSAQTKAQTKAYTHTSDKAHRKFAFMEDVGMHPDDPDRSTMVVRGRSQSRILTATKRTMRDTTDQVTLHQVSVPHKHRSSVTPRIVPYLKEGKHGPGGDFDDDPDRVIGQGHDYHPNDVMLYEEYLEQQAAFYKLHQRYPKLIPGEHVDEKMKAERDDWERWYYIFTDRYPGRGANQWVCGCAKITDDEDVSEEE